MRRWPDAHHSHSNNSAMSNTPSYQWQIFAIPPSSGTLSPLYLTAEYCNFSESQPHGGIIHHPQDHPPTHHPYFPLPDSHSPLTCKWLHSETLQICGFLGSLDALKAHHRTHLHDGPPNEQIECQWDRCSYTRRSNCRVRSMRRDTIWRHTCEVHLGMKRAT